MTSRHLTAKLDKYLDRGLQLNNRYNMTRMRILFAALVLLVVSPSLQAQMPKQSIGAEKVDFPKDILAETKWNSRILVTCLNEPDNFEILSGLEPKEFVNDHIERDIIQIHVLPFTTVVLIPTNKIPDLSYVAKTYDKQGIGIFKLAECQHDQNTISLIGKDGTLKQKWNRPITDLEVFALIDKMPMRQEEMRQKLRE